MTTPKPRIAFFHGGGSNSQISTIQCAQVSRYLQDEYEFVFFDAPFERSAGPGILPAFADKMYQPYRTWFTTSPEDGTELGDGSGFDASYSSSWGMAADGVERVWELMKSSPSVGKGEWVGVMGFSQGTRVAGGLLLDQQRRTEAGLLRKGKGEIELKFGVLCMGGGSPMRSAISHAPNPPDLVTIPVLHLHGLRDFNLANSRKQKDTYYHPSSATLLEIEYHHAMPWNRADLVAFCDAVRDFWTPKENAVA
ncbi:serine hydrolase FSH [Amylocarpus encephaloides]|uniref:Serine hydrolase FSH n=1 Tax=Amylocarpus encephaloides TaxID=45428 RepID=A0A9P7YSI9_9HELO|nr:serine hydrolase FSH [Amylocarpus encephaloides]